MKLLERVSLQIFSAIILLLGLILCLLLFGWIELGDIYYGLQWLISKPTATNTAIVVSIVLMLLSAKCIFFPSYKDEEEKHEGVLLENESGRLLISKRAIENAVKNVVNNAVKDTKDCKVIVDIDPANYLSVYVSILLNNNLKIRDMTLDLQLKIKSQIKDDFDLDVKQVNIKIDSNEKEIEKINKKESVKLNESNIEKKNLVEVEKNEEN